MRRQTILPKAELQSDYSFLPCYDGSSVAIEGCIQYDTKLKDSHSLVTMEYMKFLGWSYRVDYALTSLIKDEVEVVSCL